MNHEFLGWEYDGNNDWGDEDDLIDDILDEIEESDLFMDMDLGFELDDDPEVKDLEDWLYDLDLDWFDELVFFWNFKNELNIGSKWSEMSYNRFDKWDRWDEDNYQESDWDKFLREG
jgi:hypothetical protein